MSLRPLALISVPLLSLLASCGGGSGGSGGSNDNGPPYPRLANVWYAGTVDDVAVKGLPRWDLAVVSSTWKASDIAKLKKANPNLKILIYVFVYGLTVPLNPLDDWLGVNYAYATDNTLWWYDINGSIASDWPGTQMINMTEFAHSGPKGTWREFIVPRILKLYADRPNADGLFFDNFIAKLSTEQGSKIYLDSDCNPVHNPSGCNAGGPDTGAYLDAQWNPVMEEIARKVKEGVDHPAAITGNGASDFFPYLNGAMWEGFPTGGGAADAWNPYGYEWNAALFPPRYGYLEPDYSTSPFPSNIIQVSGADYATTNERERHKRFTLGSTLLGNGYFAYNDNGIYTNLKWQPEYDAGGKGKGYLGYPKGAPYRVLEPTGSEMLSNGKFSSGLNDWLTQSTNTDATTSVDGGALHVDVDSVSSGGSFKLTQLVNVKLNTFYTLRFSAHGDAGQTIITHLYSADCPASFCLNPKKFKLTSDWKTFEVSFRSPAAAQAGLDFFVSKKGSVWFDNISLRTGDTTVFRRDFDHGMVLVNYTISTHNVDLNGTFRRLDVEGVSIYDGAEVNEESVPPSDARILLNR